ncbi:hypothetical protein ACP3A4_004361 [Serratia marcescens]
MKDNLTFIDRTPLSPDELAFQCLALAHAAADTNEPAVRGTAIYHFRKGGATVLSTFLTGSEPIALTDRYSSIDLQNQLSINPDSCQNGKIRPIVYLA